ncbi:forkhead box protein O4 [Rhinatrema bivittatum]|uniref:forkhead box protein O4 n=1 Tax=Rhinatrema bivittatum TaxID=194408 RepID=UPI00112B92E0|nr:forkhead box protein O4 [Rhinatrema bivittatum]
MAEAADGGPVDIDPDFEPQSRPRSCTWPLPRPEPEEGRSDGQEPAAAVVPRLDSEGRAPAPAPTPKKGGSRRNAWGNQSYAELISQAIESSPDKRLTLAQIYDWMVKSVPYFKDKGDSNSSAGWKNSIRHNLSLHNKFIKVHNEATGKSSWWMLNPEGGKSGKAPRRRAASMDNTSKLNKVRGKASKKKVSLQAAADTPADSPDSQFPKWPGSPSSRSNEDSDMWISFRTRTSSNASTISIRPEHEDVQDEDIHSPLVYSNPSNSVPPTVTEELELIDGLNLLSSGSSMQSVTGSLIQQSSSFSLQPQSTSSQTSSFGNSLFNPVDISLQSSANHFTGPRTLEALLTSNSPPPSDVMMTQVDPILTQTGSRINNQNMLILGGQAAQNKLSLLGKPLELQPTSIGTGALPSTLTLLASSQSTTALTTLKAPASANSVVQLGPQHPLPSAAMAPFVGMNHDKLPTDLDVDMFMENLECDVDYIIHSDLMDEEGLDFNLDPLMPSPSPSYPGSSQASTHSWVPS